MEPYRASEYPWPAPKPGMPRALELGASTDSAPMCGFFRCERRATRRLPQTYNTFLCEDHVAINVLRGFGANLETETLDGRKLLACQPLPNTEARNAATKTNQPTTPNE